MTNYIQRGQAAINSKNMPEAVQWFEKAVKEKPADAQALACLGQALCWQGQRKKGLNLLHKACKRIAKKAIKSRDTKPLLLMIEQLQFWDDFQGSLEFAKQAVQINKNDLRGFQILSLTYSRLNKNKLALNAGLQALKKAPSNPILNILQAILEAREGQTDAATQRLETVINLPNANNEEKFRAHKELANILDKKREYNKVFPHLYKSAELAQQLPAIQKQNKSFIGQMLKTNKIKFHKDLFTQCSQSSSNTNQPSPVFLIGFLRSGTTLTQEVLDTHSNVFISDEADFIFALRNELNKISNNQSSVPEQLKNLDAADLEHLRQFYWSNVKQRYGDEFSEQLFIDKTTMNTLDLGLINCVFPEAKILFVMRDPRDICISCFMQIMTPSPTTVHLFDWQDTINLYCQTMDWWMHFKDITTLDYIEFRYEDAVSQFETTFRTVFNFIGLELNATATEFHKYAAKKYIVSPSFSQVSQPLYTSSVARWRNYDSEFINSNQQLLPYIREFNYESS